MTMVTIKTHDLSKINEAEAAKKAGSARYKAVEGSESGHGCCFGASVVDLTTAELLPKDAEPGDEQTTIYAVICECAELADAKRIAALLNAAPPALLGEE